ncbi:MAG: sigma-70 family RNA polymerase sigma factor [Myxococcota bacterium]
MEHRQAYFGVVDEFESAILPHAGELYGTAVRLTRSRSEADDLVQEAMLRAWSFWDRFQQGTNARAWMHRILMNTFINGYRRRKRERELLAEVDRDMGGRPFAQHATWEAEAEGLGDEVQSALAELPEEFRQVVLLVDFDDLSYREVADTLGCPIGTVMSRLHRGRRVLKRQLRDYAQSEGIVQQAA